MKILFCGDVVGKSGRRVLASVLPKLKEKLSPDVVIVNGENAAHGFGLTPKIFKEIRAVGADIVTLGNHAFDKKEIFEILDDEPFLVRPLNCPENTLGHGFCIYELPGGFRLAVVQLLGRVFMKSVEDPFETMKRWFETYKQGRDYDGLIVDMHAEATAEKRGMGAFLNGRALLVVGTHTHIPTADACILSRGTGYMTDAGMCGDYFSIIGMTEESALPRFFPEQVRVRLSPAEGEGTFCGVMIEFDPKKSVCDKIWSVRVGAHLENTIKI